jgi:hypothetical protein
MKIQLEDPIPSYPPFMPTSLAAECCGFAISRGLLSPYERGRIQPLAQRGRTGRKGPRAVVERTADTGTPEPVRLPPRRAALSTE